MHNNNKNSVFNPDFSFEIDNENSIKTASQKRKLEAKPPPPQTNDSDLEDSESKKELDALINKKGIYKLLSYKTSLNSIQIDHVRIKTQSAKVYILLFFTY